MPIRLVRGALRPASVRRAASTSVSDRAGGQVERMVDADRCRHGLVEQVVERGHAEDVEHPDEVVGARADVAGDELVVAGQLGEGSGHGGLRCASMLGPPAVIGT